MRKRVTGIVKSDKPDKTVTVEVVKRVLHPRYKKYIKRRTRLYAHDEKNECKPGDKVLIEEIRPLSKLKRWRVVERVEK